MNKFRGIVLFDVQDEEKVNQAKVINGRNWNDCRYFSYYWRFADDITVKHSFSQSRNVPNTLNNLV